MARNHGLQELTEHTEDGATETMLIEVAGLEDLDALAGMFAALVNDVPGDRHPRPQLWKEQTAALMKQDHYVCYKLTLEGDGRIVGFMDALCYVEAADEYTAFNIRHVYITPEWRHHGLCERLYAEMIDTARKAGASRMVIAYEIGGAVQLFLPDLHEKLTGKIAQDVLMTMEAEI